MVCKTSSEKGDSIKGGIPGLAIVESDQKKTAMPSCFVTIGEADLNFLPAQSDMELRQRAEVNS